MCICGFWEKERGDEEEVKPGAGGKREVEMEDDPRTDDDGRDDVCDYVTCSKTERQLHKRMMIMRSRVKMYEEWG